MNKLWEEYIYRMLIRTKRDDIQVNFQNKQKFWEGRTIRPDLVITKKLEGVFSSNTKPAFNGNS